jgi:hypothetical protein
MILAGKERTGPLRELVRGKVADFFAAHAICGEVH